MESGGNELWSNARFELLKVEVHRDRGSAPTGVDNPGGGKEANMSEREPEPRRAVARRVRGVKLGCSDGNQLTGPALLYALAIVKHVPHSQPASGLSTVKV